jgi:hypothetical protein
MDVMAQAAALGYDQLRAYEESEKDYHDKKFAASCAGAKI